MADKNTIHTDKMGAKRSARFRLVLGIVIIVAVFAVIGLAYFFTDIFVPYGSTPTPTPTAPENPLEGTVLFAEKYPAPSPVNYTASDGVQFSDFNAYPGLVVLLVDYDTARVEVQSLVVSVGGQLVMEMPQGGVYWARVQLGLEGDFIDEVLNEFFVVDAFPLVPSAVAATTSVDADVPGVLQTALQSRSLDSQIVILDVWKGQQTGHGARVSTIASDAGGASLSKTEVDVTHQPTSGNAFIRNDYTLGALNLAIFEANKSDRVTAINISIGSGGEVTSFEDHHGNTSTPCINTRRGELQYLEMILHNLEGRSEGYLDHALITLALGNSGVDMTNEIMTLKRRYPNAWKRIILAGGLDKNNERFRGYNTSENPDDVLYAKVPENLLGTSFSAPQSTGLAAAIAAARPKLTASQIKRAILESAPVINTYRTMPTLEAALRKADEIAKTTTLTTTTKTTTTTPPTTTSAPSSRYDGTYAATVTTVTPNGTTTGQGTFTVVNGRVSAGSFNGTVDANGNFVGTMIVSPGSPAMTITGKFVLSGNFTLRGSSGNTSYTVVAHKI